MGDSPQSPQRVRFERLGCEAIHAQRSIGRNVRGGLRRSRSGRGGSRPALLIQWEPGSDLIGDFVWVNNTTWLLVTGQVREVLQERFQGFAFGEVAMIQNPKLKPPQRRTRRSKPRIWLPYEGPPLHQLVVEAWADADLDRSSLTPTRMHPTQGYMRYRVEGDEHFEFRGEYPNSTYVRVPREPGKGFYIAEKQLKEADIFNVVQFPGWRFCKETVRDFILARQLTNMGFFEVGETF